MQRSNNKNIEGPTADGPDHMSVRIPSVVKLATSVWKLDRALTKEYGDNQDIPLRLRVPILDIQKLVEDVGIEIIDLSGRPYDRGFAVEVKAYAPNVTKDTENLVIIEMLSPVIMLNGSLVQAGEVVLGIKQ